MHMKKASFNLVPIPPQNCKLSSAIAVVVAVVVMLLLPVVVACKESLFDLLPYHSKLINSVIPLLCHFDNTYKHI